MIDDSSVFIRVHLWLQDRKNPHGLKPIPRASESAWATSCPSYVFCSCRALEAAALFVYGLDDVLNGLDLLLLEQGFAALFADPGRDVVDGDVAAITVDVDRSFAPLHGSLAVDAFHGFFLTRYPSVHSSGAGT